MTTLAWVVFAFCVGMILGGEFAQWAIGRFRKRSDAGTPLDSAEPSEALRANEALKVQLGTWADGTPRTVPAFRWRDAGLPERKVWGEIPYEEQAPMFLDQFLLRYFYELVQPIDFSAKGRPWELFVQKNPWAKEMPVLFHQLTSIQLTDMQLNGAIADYMSRVGKLNAG